MRGWGQGRLRRWRSGKNGEKSTTKMKMLFIYGVQSRLVADQRRKRRSRVAAPVRAGRNQPVARREAKWGSNTEADRSRSGQRGPNKKMRQTAERVPPHTPLSIDRSPEPLLGSHSDGEFARCRRRGAGCRRRSTQPSNQDRPIILARGGRASGRSYTQSVRGYPQEDPGEVAGGRDLAAALRGTGSRTRGGGGGFNGRRPIGPDIDAVEREDRLAVACIDPQLNVRP